MQNPSNSCQWPDSCWFSGLCFSTWLHSALKQRPFLFSFLKIFAQQVRKDFSFNKEKSKSICPVCFDWYLFVWRYRRDFIVLSHEVGLLDWLTLIRERFGRIFILANITASMCWWKKWIYEQLEVCMCMYIGTAYLAFEAPIRICLTYNLHLNYSAVIFAIVRQKYPMLSEEI